MAELLPELTFAAARELGTFPEFDYVVEKKDVAAYRKITGSRIRADDDIPSGFAAIFGRLGYLSRHSMPPGGVLLAQDIVWHRAAKIDRPLRIRSTVIQASERQGKRKLTFLTTAYQDGELVAEVRIEAGWPK